jgi:hypothetical protein
VNRTWASRIVAIAVLTVHVTFLHVWLQHRLAARWSAPGSTAQAAYLSRLQHAHFGHTFPILLAIGLAYVLLVEGLAYVLRLLAGDLFDRAAA